MSAHAVLALDQGTTGSTALVLAADGRVLGRGYAELPQHFPRPGWVEHDPEDLWTTATKAIRAALSDAELEARGDAIAALGISNQRETTVVWDRATGRPVHRAVVWQSRQSAEICRRLEADGHAEHVRSTTGLVIDAYFSASKIRWILDRDPSLQERAERGELAFGTVDAWTLWRLTGGGTTEHAVHATDPTNASRTMLFDIHRRAWDDTLLDILRIPRSILPRVAATSSEIFGHCLSDAEAGLEAQTGLPDGVPIAGIAGDQQAALFGQACWRPGEAKNTYGTGCFLVMNTGDRAVASAGGLLTSLACDARGRPAYCLEGSVFSAGSAVQWLRDGLGVIDDAAASEALATSIDDTGGVYVVPAFSGLGAPYWDMDARGAVVGLTRGSGRAELCRAVLESIAYQTRDVLDLMRRESDVDLPELRVDGGAAANDFLMQFQADLLGVPVDRPRLVETTALGAGLLAGLAVGFWNDPEDAAEARRADRHFEPAMDDERRARLYDGWRDAVARVLTR